MGDDPSRAALREIRDELLAAGFDDADELLRWFAVRGGRRALEAWRADPGKSRGWLRAVFRDGASTLRESPSMLLRLLDAAKKERTYAPEGWPPPIDLTRFDPDAVWRAGRDDEIPDCCIAAFVADLRADRPPAQLRGSLPNATGCYVPCWDCLAKAKGSAA